MSDDRKPAARDNSSSHGSMLWVVAIALAGGILAVAFASNVGGDTAACGSAVAVWLDRKELPLPRMAAGTKDLEIRSSWAATSDSASDWEGCYRVELYRRGSDDRLVATYDVAWRGEPASYRLVSATNALTSTPLPVRHVPELGAGDLASAGRGDYTYSPFN